MVQRSGSAARERSKTTFTLRGSSSVETTQPSLGGHPKQQLPPSLLFLPHNPGRVSPRSRATRQETMYRESDHRAYPPWQFRQHA